MKKINAYDVAPRTKKSNYPEKFAVRMEGREKRQIGDAFELTKFGVNLTILSPKSESALFHEHTKQEEFIFILEGNPTLVTNEGEFLLGPNDCAGFKPGKGAHMLVNRSDKNVVYIEIGDREKGDEASYPNDDLKASQDAEGKWVYHTKDGRPY